MNKRYLHHIYVRLRSVRYWHLIILLFAFITLTIVGLRANNLRMIELREAVVVADKQGEGVNEALDQLRSHVYTHMNANLSSGDNAIKPPIQLTQSYQRLANAERDRVAKINQRVSDNAVKICEEKYPAGRLRDGRVQCVSEYISKNSVSEVQIPKELYQFDFVSPSWSPDLAGFSLLLSGVFALLLLFRFVLDRWLRSQLD
jgi:hypothetical protein